MIRMRKKIINKNAFIILLFLMLGNLNSYGSQAVDSLEIRIYTSDIELRNFSSSKISEFKSDRRFDYGARPVVKPNFLDKILRWIAELIAKVSQYTATYAWLKWLFYALLAGVIVYAILKLMGVDINKAIYRQIDRGNLPFDVLDENIHELDFERLIQEAIDSKEYKKAIRLYYLFALKKLSDKQLIHWQAGKTNHNYQAELKVASIKPSFDNLGYYFDYAWYGDFTINQSLFSKVKVVFGEFKQAVESHTA